MKFAPVGYPITLIIPGSNCYRRISGSIVFNTFIQVFHIVFPEFYSLNFPNGITIRRAIAKIIVIQ